MLKTLSKIWKRRRGSNAAEFALVTPIYFMLVIGGLEYSWFFAQSYVVNAGARACARAAALTSADADGLGMLEGGGAYSAGVAAANDTFARYGNAVPSDTKIVLTDLGNLVTKCTITAPYTAVTGVLYESPGGFSQSAYTRTED